ncbi:MAG TPA: right-handed parallel beta-helix repeat-containing protein [Solirubrobacteraceae bacterium]|nr:right-handed parallel beta-helix repeat-containing protein [Solirubrobacteraceae bacterium]
MRKVAACSLLPIAAVLVLVAPHAFQTRAAATSARTLPAGDTKVEPRRGSLNPGRPQAFQLRARSTGAVEQVRVYLDRGTTARAIVVGLYSNAAGHPGRLLSTGRVSSPRPHAWNTVSISQRRLLSGNRYWLAVLATGGKLRYRYARDGRCPSETGAQRRLRRLPQKWLTGRAGSRCPISAYATATAGPTPGATAAPPAAGVAPGQSPVAKILPSKAPLPSPACTTILSSVSALASQVTSAVPGSAICLTAGTYGQLELSGAHAGNVTVESVPGSAVALAGVKVAAGASNLTIHDFATREINLAPGASHITIDHNDISGGGEGIVNSSVNCSSPNAPTYSGCTSTAPNSYITISGNKIHGYGEGGGEDAIHLSNWEHIDITANEIYGLEEHGNHTDAFQSVFGGSDLTFDHNYEHDNQSQGFFIKDGDASNVTVSDNLFLRNDNLGEGENNIQVFNTAGFTMTGNTVWDGQGDLIRAENAAEPLSATVNHNVEQLFSVLHESGPAYSLSEDYDIFKEQPLFAKGPHSTVVAKPAFANPSADDYRLVTNPNKIGVDWAPSEYVYGPTGY